MGRIYSADDRIITALDVDSFEKMKAIVEELGDLVSFYKVGMELYYAEGSKTVEWLHGKGKRVFLDLKMYDIPNTVAHGISSVSEPGIDLITIHASGGRAMMEAAVKAADKAERNKGIRPKILAVTVLTSFDETTWDETGGQLPIASQVLRLAKLAKECGADGVVASPEEAKGIRELCGNNFEIVTPGIRPAFAGADDQKRIATPAMAINNGATRLVIGRPIIKADDPKKAVRIILEEIRENKK